MQPEKLLAKFEQLLLNADMEALFPFLQRHIPQKETRQSRFLLLTFFAAACRVFYNTKNKIPPVPDHVSLPHLLALCRLTAKSIRHAQKSGKQQICAKALAIMDRDFKNADLTLSGIGRQIGVSPQYLSRLIKATTGKSYKQILTSRRIKSAKTDLTLPHIKIREVAERNGYTDPHYFSHAFKKETGFSPDAYRRQAKHEKS